MPSASLPMVESALLEDDQLINDYLLNAKDATDVTKVIISAFSEKRVYHPLGEQALVAINPGTINQGEHALPSDTSILETTLSKFLEPFSFDARKTNSRTNLNQTIIALGESGSGKSTLLRKSIHQMFVTKDLLHNSVVDRLDERMKMAEILGNAKTSNNDDSSRMGKLIEIFQRKNGLDFILRPLMLEDGRLRYLRPATRQPTPQSLDRVENQDAQQEPPAFERSFHIFSHLATKGHPVFSKFPDLLDNIEPDQNPETWQWIEATVKAFGLEVNVVWDLVAATWLLATAEGLSSSKIALAQEYLAMDQGFDLTKSLTELAREEKIDEREAIFVFSKCVYRELFGLLVPLHQQDPSERPPQGPFLYFADICGAEVLKENRLQQLLINDCNDRLDVTYKRLAIAHLPGAKKQHQPGLTYNAPSIPVKTPMETLLEGIMTCSSSEAMSKLLDLYKGTAKDPTVTYDPRDRTNTGLKVIHANGHVPYLWSSFFRDKIDAPGKERIAACRAFQLALTDETRGKKPTQKPSRGQRDVVGNYQRDCRTLNAALSSKQVLFLRCIKAHSNLKPWETQTDLVLRQVESLGVAQILDFLRDLPGRCSDTLEVFERKFGSLVVDSSDRVGTLADILKLEVGGRPASEMTRVHNGIVYYSVNLRNGFRKMIAAREAAAIEAQRKKLEVEREKRMAAELEAQRVEVERAKQAAKLEACRLEAEQAEQRAKLEAQRLEVERAKQAEAQCEEERVGTSGAKIPEANAVSNATIPEFRLAVDEEHRLKPAAPLLDGGQFGLTPAPARRESIGILPTTAIEAGLIGLLYSILRDWRDTTDSIQRRAHEKRLQYTILVEIETKMYTSGVEAGRQHAFEAHDYLLSVIRHCRQTPKGKTGSSIEQNDMRVELLIVLDRIFEVLEAHYTMLALANMCEGVQEVRCRSLGIDMSPEVVEILGSATSDVWRRLAMSVRDQTYRGTGLGDVDFVTV